MDNPNKAKPVTIALYPAQIKEIGKIENLTGQSRSNLIQQAVNALISQYKAALEQAKGGEA